MGEPSFTLGLVLSGGAVRGGAHVGVYKVLEQEGIEPDIVVGVSAGAIIGAAIAAGVGAEQLEDYALDQSWLTLARPSLNLKASLFDLRGGERLLRKVLKLTSFDRMERRFAAVACDITTGEEVVLTEGDVVEAVLASASVPGLFAARPIDGHTLVDGGLVNNLPTDVARSLGADTLISVDLLELPSGRQAEAPKTVIETWQRALYFLIQRRYPKVGEREVRIVPELFDASFTDFDQMPEIIASGEAATRRALPAIRALLNAPS
jgi:NTE family protein